MLHHLLAQQTSRALALVNPEFQSHPVLVRPCQNPKFGDYQTNSIMPLAKRKGMNPRELAAQVTGKLDLAETCEKIDIAGPGFLNFKLRRSAVLRLLKEALAGRHLFFGPVQTPKTVILDFSSPNVAKPMHVGHIRSTILGDCLARICRLLGHRVKTDNHIGDWGTQFGKLIVGWKRELDSEALKKDPVGEMERLYQTIHSACDSDPGVLEESRRELVKLQSSDPENRRIWEAMIELSKDQFERVYQRLGVRFDHVLGESFYADRIPKVVESLKAAGIAQESQGALAVFFDDIPDLKDHPALVLKSDGAANYTTTDLATLDYRAETWDPDEIVYVTDARQQLHFRQLFEIFRRWRPDCQAVLSHVAFGSILGEGGKPFRTRAGKTVRLSALLDEAEERAFQLVTEKNPALPENQRRDIARVVGIGAIKYADLLPNRQSDYVFSWEKMLSLNGNTAPYLLYAYTRIQSIFTHADSETLKRLDSLEEIKLEKEAELSLAKHLLNFGLILEMTAEEYRPNYLCNYLYDLAGYYARFYENCPVLKSEEPVRSSRLALCRLTGEVLKTGLNALGIETTTKM